MWSAAALLGFVNLVNIEEIPNVITNESVDLVPLSITSVNYLIFSAMRQNTFITLINAGVNKLYEK